METIGYMVVAITQFGGEDSTVPVKAFVSRSDHRLAQIAATRFAAKMAQDTPDNYAGAEFSVEIIKIELV